MLRAVACRLWKEGLKGRVLMTIAGTDGRKAESKTAEVSLSDVPRQPYALFLLHPWDPCHVPSASPRGSCRL